VVVSDSTADVYPSAGTGGLILADGNAHRMVGRAVAGCRLPVASQFVDFDHNRPPTAGR
jgi:hypothetical protein